MKFMLMIQNDAKKEVLAPREQTTVSGDHGAFARGLIDGGRWVDGARLRPSNETARVTRPQGREGTALIVDGPFAEAKEVLGGYYVFDAASRDEAIATAEKCPMAESDVLEVREVMSMSDPSQRKTGPAASADAKKYLVTVANDARDPAQWDRVMDRVAAEKSMCEGLFTSGSFVSGARLTNVQKGFRVTKRGEKRIVSDGPFAEAKEIVGGYCMLRCKTRDEAIEWAKSWGGSFHGVCDVMPVWELNH